MTQQAVLFEKIEKLPPQYFGQVFDFVGYIEQKAKEAEALAKAKAERSSRDIELINKHAEELNKEAMEGWEYQKEWIFESDEGWEKE